MRRVKNALPDYSFCRQTVTLYHAMFEPEFRCRRIVFNGAYFDCREMGDTTAEGQKRERRCFLLLPSGGKRLSWGLSPQIQDGFFIEPGDRVMEHIGPDIESREEWNRFTPDRVPGLCVVKEVSVKQWQGIVRHVEVQTEWYKRW